MHSKIRELQYLYSYNSQIGAMNADHYGATCIKNNLFSFYLSKSIHMNMHSEADSVIKIK